MNATRRAAVQQGAAAAGASALRLRDLRFGWTRGASPILDIGELQVTRGERVFIEGPSGSGKSSLLSLLGAVAPADSGELEVLGTDLTRLTARQRDRFRADHIGFVFQMFNLVPYLSMLDNVCLPCRFSRRRREQALARSATPEAEARRLLAALELDHPALLARPVTELSIGQQQRVAVARALMGSPALLIADEPTSALDEGSRKRFLDLLFAECEALTLTLLFVSHDARLGTWFSRHVALADINRATAPH